jgi:hypothetical protein
MSYVLANELQATLPEKTLKKDSMSRIKLLSPVLLLCSCFAIHLHGQNLWTGIVAPSRAIDWSNAGAPHINDTRTQCVTSACNTVSGGSVTVTTINAAIASAAANTYVLIPAGTFNIAGGIVFGTQSNITLRGSGSNSTSLVWTSSGGGGGNCGGHDICTNPSEGNYAGGPSNTANWTAGYAQGTTSITLSSTSGLVVGNPIILDQIDTQSDNGALYVGCEIGSGTSGGDSSADCYSGAYPNGFERGGGSLSTIRGQQQIVTVTSISGNTVGISPGIYASNWASSHSPGAWWSSGPDKNDAVENISLDHTGGGDGIDFFNCQGCWVKGIRSIRQSNTGTAWGHVNLSICNQCTVRDSYFYGYPSDTYGVAVGIGSDDLIENNIFHYFVPTTLPNSDCEGCVWSYNFQPGAFSGSSTFLGNSSEMHGTTLYMLEEGNIGPGTYEDSFHGTHDLDTQFRNRWDGMEQNNGNIVDSNTTPYRLNPGARYQNAIGNILGTIGFHTTYQATTTSGNPNVSIISCGLYQGFVTPGDTLSCPTSMFWGNWDSVTNAVRWNSSEVPTGLSSYSNTVPSSHTLPASFYYSSKPSWWPTGKAWPAIGPDVTGGNVGQCRGGTYDSSEATAASQCSGGTFTALGMVTSIPAMDCYFNVMHGSANGTGNALPFDASACFTSSSSSGGGTGSAPEAPTNLSGVVH